MNTSASDITQMLQAAAAGDTQAGERALSLLYGEMQRLARSRLHKSGELTLLDATGLVHETYLRLQAQAGLDFADRRHFLAYAAKTMHHIVIDLVRAASAERRGGGQTHITLNTAHAELPQQRDEEILRVHEALDELAALEPRLAQVVEMRYYAGMTEPEIALALGLSERTVRRDWDKARALLRSMLSA